MAWIEGTEDRTFTVAAPYDEVVDFFCEPAQFKDAFSQMEKAEEVEPKVWHWTLQKKSEKGITFQGDYTVAYEREGDEATWSTRDGNMRSSGRVSFREIGPETTQVHYVETLATDLPIPRLMARVFQPIVGREIRKGVGDFLDRAQSILESR